MWSLLNVQDEQSVAHSDPNLGERYTFPSPHTSMSLDQLWGIELYGTRAGALTMNKIRKAKEVARRVKAEEKRARKPPRTKLKALT